MARAAIPALESAAAALSIAPLLPGHLVQRPKRGAAAREPGITAAIPNGSPHFARRLRPSSFSICAQALYGGLGPQACCRPLKADPAYSVFVLVFRSDSQGRFHRLPSETMTLPNWLLHGNLRGGQGNPCCSSAPAHCCFRCSGDRVPAIIRNTINLGNGFELGGLGALPILQKASVRNVTRTLTLAGEEIVRKMSGRAV